MADKTTTLHILGSAWLNDPADSDTALLENEDGRVVVERTDANEVAIHFTLLSDSQATVSLYASRMDAFALAGLLQMEASSE